MLWPTEVLQQFAVALIEVAYGIVDYLPVYEVLRMKYWQTWSTLE
jgi:hypothetical protein